ncbi:hypothetical protein AVEN_222084-1 [Araneus ventricosus]|uniref:Uncharacterized protein n=1 Tax=Araneus ventricosus TaxID=182803 RepID=A0A4Y2DU32_ARAVE|nr:hypothetical protein AVEN_222084-1 [Araneus ventricosus]
MESENYKQCNCSTSVNPERYPEIFITQIKLHTEIERAGDVHHRLQASNIEEESSLNKMSNCTAGFLYLEPEVVSQRTHANKRNRIFIVSDLPRLNSADL